MLKSLHESCSGNTVRVTLCALCVALACSIGALSLPSEGAYALEGALAPSALELTTQASSGIPKSAVKYKNHYYKVYKYSSSSTPSWTAAKKACEKLGGHLATITSSGEQSFIEDLKQSSDYLWLGGYSDSNYKWHWVSGEKWGYTNWKSGEPTDVYAGERENRLGTYPNQWNDFPNKYSSIDGYICEWDYNLRLSDTYLELDKGSKTYVTYSLITTGGKEVSAKATWKTSNKKVAKVSSKGKVVAVGVGSCTITCKVRNITKTVKVIVKPGRVKNLKAISKSKNYIQLRWAKQTGVSSYQVYLYDTDIEEYDLVKTVSGNFNTARISDLSSNRTYKFKVRGVVKSGSKRAYGAYSRLFYAKTAR